MDSVNLKDKDEFKSSSQESSVLTSHEEALGNGFCGKQLVLFPTHERRTKDECSECEDPIYQRNDRPPQNDVQKLSKKRISSEESAVIPVIDTEEYYASSKDQAKNMRKETRRLNSEMKQLANSCMRISEENKFLLDELKQICAPDVIAMLEAKNPDKNPQN